MTPTSFPFFFFFNDTATTEIYTLSLHDALPISDAGIDDHRVIGIAFLQVLQDDTDVVRVEDALSAADGAARSEEHTSELQSPCNLVCRLLLEKKRTPRSSRSTPLVASRSTFCPR